MTAKAPAAVYVHIPFCARVCPYCDFAVVAGRDDLTRQYVEALVAEISHAESIGPVAAVNFGGGTPSRLRDEQLSEILEALRRRFDVSADAEVSIEVNPEDWSKSAAADAGAVGFNRVSIGAQSLDPAVLAELGRVHAPADVASAVGNSRRAGFSSVSLDLIFGASAETDESWHRTLAATLALSPDHVSTYALTVERGTALARLIAAGEAPEPDPDTQARRYLAAAEALTAGGLGRYEVSNYARPGHECRYNLNTWHQGDYLGFGLGAHSHFRGRRWRNLRRIDAYLSAIAEGRHPRAGYELVDGWDRLLEGAFLGLRLAGGVSAPAVAAEFAKDPDGQRLMAAGLVAVEGGHLRMLDPLFTDGAARVVLGLPAPPVSSRAG